MANPNNSWCFGGTSLVQHAFTTLDTGNGYHPFPFSVFCHSQSSLQCTIACNLHRTMLIEMHVTFHYVISTTLKRHSLHEFLMPLHDLPPPAFQPLIHCGLYLTPFLFKDYAYENLLFKIPKLHCITIRPSSNQS